MNRADPEDARAGPPPSLSARLLTAAAAGAVRAIGSSLRVRVEGEERLRERVRAGRPVVLASLHGRLPLGVCPMAPYRPWVMISRSRDGERIAGIVQRLGYRVVRGSSSRAGRSALVTLIRGLREGGVAVHLVDGPRGPAGVVKPGLVTLAAQAGACVLPLSGTAWPRFVGRSWDRIQIPLPGARMRLHFGEPIEIPVEPSPETVAAICETVATVLAADHARLEALVRAGSRGSQ